MRPQSAHALGILALTLATGTAVADIPERIYLEENGIVLFDVENEEAVGGWELKTDIEDYEGSGYFEWTAPSAFSQSSAGRGNITYHFRIQTPGNYQIRWRNYIAMGESNTEHNDSWVRLATGEDIADQHPLEGNWTKIYMNTFGNWSWSSNTVDHERLPIRQYFSQGDHTLEISGRSMGHAIDRIAVYRYADVNYNSQIINTWELSSIITPDGSITNPEEPSDPEEPTDPEETNPTEPVELINLALAPDNWQELESNQCAGNTLALSALDTVTFDPSDSNSEFTSETFATLVQGSSALLLKFDTSLVPAVESAVIEYGTGEAISDGELLYALGSHSNWQSDESDGTTPPDVLLELNRASGGWEANSRYHSALQATALSAGINTLIISSESDTDPLSIFAEPSSDLAPRLLLTGSADFCTNWQANVDASNEPVEPPEEINEQTEPEEPVEPESEPESEPETDNRDSQDTRKSGGSSSWWMLFALFLPLTFRYGSTASIKSIHAVSK